MSLKLGKTSNRAVENLPQRKLLSLSSERRTMHALSEEFDPTILQRARASLETTDVQTQLIIKSVYYE